MAVASGLWRRAIQPAAAFRVYDSNRAAAPRPPTSNRSVLSSVSPTVATADDSYVRHRAIDVTFGSAFAASVAVHLTTLAVLVAVGAGTGGGTSIGSSWIDRPLEVALAVSPITADTEKGGIAYETSPTATVHVPAPHESAANVASVGRQASSLSRAEEGRAGSGFAPRVTVDDRVPRARFAEALEGGALAPFPLEVESPVVLPGRLAVPYPAAALDKRREGSVLAWAIVDRQGAVEEMQVVDGTPEFADAVRATLATTRFIPARNEGAPIRFYVMLEFDFRIDARDTATAAPASSAAGRR
jgi:TonB family protein